MINAIILAAGIGSRLVPLTYSMPKAMVKIHNEFLIERQIQQLINHNIKEIIIVVGYKKENFEFLKNKYYPFVKIIYNPYFDKKNNFYSLFLAKSYLKNTFILTCDTFFKNNIFQKSVNSWYATQSSNNVNEWGITTNSYGKIISITKFSKKKQPFLIGPAFFNYNFSKKFKKIITNHSKMNNCDNLFWEDILINHLDSLEIYQNSIPDGEIFEIDSIKDLKNLDALFYKYNKIKEFEIICHAFNIEVQDINNIIPQKFDKRNYSFTFEIKGIRYIFIKPTNYSDFIINQKNNFDIYTQIKNTNFYDKIIYFNPHSGVKILKFLKNTF